MPHPKYRTNKIGALPWRLELGEIQFLIHLPQPKADAKNPGFAANGLPLADEAMQMQWGVMRGTVQRAQKTGHEKTDDIASIAELQTLSPEAIEDHADAMRREAEQELGILPEMIVAGSLLDAGFHLYESETKGRGTYPIHVYSFQIDHAMRDMEAMLNAAEKESQRIGWYSVRSIVAMAEAGTFKPGYVHIVKVVEQAIKDER